MAALSFLAKYRETGLLLLRVAIGVLFIVLAAPILMAGSDAWAHSGSAMRNIGIASHPAFWGFAGALAQCVAGVLLIFGLFFRIGALLLLATVLVHAAGVLQSRADFFLKLQAIELCVLLLSLLLIGPGKYSVDKN